MIRVIIAEDIDILRRRIKNDLLRSEKIEVVGEAASASEAVDVAMSVDFDIALLDIEMESSDSGIDAASRILEIKPESKVIFLTLHESDEVVFKALESGAVDYIIKSEDATNVVEHIEKAYQDKAQIGWKVQNKMQKEFLRLRKSEMHLVFFIHNISILTPAEKALLALLVEGYSIKDISEKRYVEITTIKTQISHILKKLHVRRTKDIVDQIKEMKLESLLNSQIP